MSARVVVWLCFCGVVVVLAVLIVAWILGPGLDNRHRTEQREQQCHALGTAYHYWDEREHCVRYVDLGAAS